MFRAGRRRVMVLRLIFLLGMALVVGRLAVLQVGQHRTWFYRGFLNRERVQPRPVKRGAIRDRNGAVLVEDRGAHDVDLVYRDFRRGNPFGLAFHLYLETLRDPGPLSRSDFEVTHERIIIQRQVWRLQSHLWRAVEEGRREEAARIRREIRRREERLGKELAYRQGKIPDPRKATLAWARTDAGQDALVTRILRLGSAAMPDPERRPLPRRLARQGVSREDWDLRARIVRSNIRFYLTRIIGHVWRLRGERDPRFRLRWEGRGRTPEREVGRRWRRDLLDREDPVPSFARWFGVTRPEVEQVVRRGLEVLDHTGALDGRRNPITVLDRIHKRNVRALLLYQGRNLWRVWERNFRDRMAMIENRRDPLWRYVDYGTVRKIALEPRAHQGFFVVNSVRRIYTTVTGDSGTREWVPGLRLYGGVSGFTLDDARQLARPLVGRWVDSVAIDELDPVSMSSYRELLRRRARVMGSRVWRVGRGGLEWRFDKDLTGTEGYQVTEVNRGGELQWEHFQAPRRPGKDVAISVDFTLQVALEQALQDSTYHGGGPLRHAGAAVVDSRSGQILALACYPLYTREQMEKRLFEYLDTEQERRAKAKAKAGEDTLALLRRSRTLRADLVDWSRRMPGKGMPGSTFKVVTALAGLRAGIAQSYTCPGDWSPGWTVYECHCGGAGLEGAIKESCNAYFGSLARKLPPGALRAEARRLGIAVTEADRQDSVLPLRADRSYVEARARDASVGIGYGVNATPLALARLYAGVATGTLPELGIRAGKSGPGTDLGIPPAELARVHAGMRQVVQAGGTAHLRDGTMLQALRVAGKTGTALHGKDPASKRNCWFAGFLEYGDKSIAFAVLVPGCPPPCQGGNTAAPVIEKFLADAAVRKWLAAKEGR